MDVFRFHRTLVGLSIIIACYFPFLSYATEAGDEWLNAFEQQTEIATKTKLNVKYVPGIVDILYAKTLRQRGYKTVLDALSRLPGIQTLTSSYRTNPNVRGNISDTIQGDVQILINGIPQVSGNDLQPFAALDMPLAAIERIEVIKGPGSAIHGEYAINGVINIITVKETEGGTAYVKAGDFDTQVYSVNQRTHVNDWELSLAASRSTTDGSQPVVDNDAYSVSSTPLLSNAPGKADTRMLFDSFIAQASYDNTIIDFNYMSTLQGDNFGSLEWLTADDQYKDEIQSTSFQISHKLENLWNGDLTIYAGLQRYMFDRRIQFAPANAVAPGSSDIYVDTESKVDKKDFRLKWVSQKNNHRLLFEGVYQYIDVPYTRDQTNYPVPISVNKLPNNTWSLFGLNKEILSIVAQDEITLSDDSQLVIATRIDDYDGRDTVFSPRASYLYKVSNNDILKFQIARAFRPPSLHQEGGASDIKNEIMDIFEFQISHYRKNAKIENTVYVSRLKNKMLPRYKLTGNVIQDFDFVNISDELNFYGIESSFQYSINQDFSAEIDLAYGKGDGVAIQKSNFFVSPWTMDFNLNWQMSEYLNLFIEQRYWSSRKRRPDSTREKFKSQNVTNLSLTVFPNRLDDFSISLNIENVFDDDVRAPSGFIYADAYLDDFPVKVRNINLAMEYHW